MKKTARLRNSARPDGTRYRRALSREPLARAGRRRIHKRLNVGEHPPLMGFVVVETAPDYTIDWIGKQDTSVQSHTVFAEGARTAIALCLQRSP